MSDSTAESSTAESAEATAEVVATGTENVAGTAESSAADGAVKPASMLEAVKAAVAPTGDASTKPADGKDAAPSPSAGKDGQQGQQAKPAQAATPDDEAEFSKLPFRKHPVFVRVTGDLKATRAKLETAESELKVAKDTVEKQGSSVKDFESFRGHVQSAGLSAQEVNDGFAIMAAMKSDPQRALEMLMPYVGGLQQAAGEHLPPDLADKVEKGLVDEATAQELARQRARVQITASQHERSTQQVQQQRQQQVADSIARSVTDWDRAWQKSDPDYPKLLPRVEAEMHRLWQTRGVPQNPADAVKLAQEARDTVTDWMKGMLPAKPAVRNIGNGSSNPSAIPKPRNMLEAVRQSLANGSGG